MSGFNNKIAEGSGSQGRGSTDEDSVSWLAPLGRFQMVYAQDTPGHHRDLAAQAAMPYAGRALLQTAKVFAGATLDLCADPKTFKTATDEFRKGTRGFTYDPLVPKRQKVPIDPP